MTQSSRPRVLTEQDAGTMDTLIKRGESAASAAEQKTAELQGAANDLTQLKASVPAAAKSAADLATAQAKTTLDLASSNANSAAAAALASLATLPKFRSADASNPPNPSQAELDANPNGIWGVKLNADGVAQQLKWSPHTLAGTWQAVGAPPASAQQVERARLLAVIASAFDSTNSANPRNPTAEEIAAFQAANGHTLIGGSRINAEGWRQPLIWQGGAWVVSQALPKLDTGLLADIAQTQIDVYNTLQITRVPTRAALAGKLAGTYIITAENVQVAWDGNAVVTGSESPVLASATALNNVAARLGNVIYAAEYGIKAENTAEQNRLPIIALATAVNAVYNDGYPVTVQLPAGSLDWDTEAWFKRPVTVVGHDTVINDLCPSGKYVLRFAPDSIGPRNSTEWRKHRFYHVSGIRFAAGRTSAGGIYFNEGVTSPRVTSCSAYDYGNRSGAMIRAQCDNWFLQVVECQFIVTDSNEYGGFLQTYSRSAADPQYWDGGMSKTLLINCVTTIVPTQPIPYLPIIRLTGYDSLLDGCIVEGGSDLVHALGGYITLISCTLHSGVNSRTGRAIPSFSGGASKAS